MNDLVKLLLIAVIVAAAVLGVLRMTDVIPPGDLGEAALKTFGSIAIIFAAAVGIRAVRGKSDNRDEPGQPVP